jgi:hypothetical protein
MNNYSLLIQYRLVKRITLRLAQGSSALFPALNMIAERIEAIFFHSTDLINDIDC